MSLIESEQWARLYRRHAASVRRALRSKLERAVATLARQAELDDMVQDVFTRALASRRLLTSGVDPEPYLLTAARNRWIDSLRRQRHPAVLALPLGEVDGELAIEAQSLHPVEDGLIEHEYDVAIVARYVSGLSGDLRSVYEARFVQDLSQRDAAERLGVTRRRIRTLEQELVRRAAAELDPSPPAPGC